MPIQGFTRLRQHNFGRQAALNTKVAAKRAYGFAGVPAPNRNWTDPDVATGSIDPVVTPFLGAPDITAPLTDPRLAYNTLPIILSAFFGGGVTPTGGTAKTWVFTPASVAPLDDDDVYTYEFGDDVLTDWYQFGDGLLEGFEITGPEGLSVLTTSMTWRFGSFSSTGSTDNPVTGTVPTPGVTPDINEAVVYLKDAGIFISDDSYSVLNHQVSDALHSFVLRGTQARDQKRFANADQSFDIDAYGRGARTIQLECTFAKTAETVGLGSESDAWMSDTAVNRYVSLVFTSTAEADTGVFYKWSFSMPMRYYTRTEGEVGGNTVVVLTGHAFDDEDDFGGVFSSTVVNTLATAGL